MRIGYFFLALALIWLFIGTVAAADDICSFNSSVDIAKSDLPAYVSDQTGCGIQNVSESSGAIIIFIFFFFVLLFIYGVIAGKK